MKLRRGRRINPARKHRKWGKIRSHKRRTNAGIVPFLRTNPSLFQNPRRRRARRNPGLLGGLGGKLNFKAMATKALHYGTGSALGTAIDMYGVSRIQNVWLNSGVRVAGSVVLGSMLGSKWSDVSASAAGALMSPMWRYLAARYLAPAASAPEADLDSLAADLNEALSDYETENAGGDLF